MAISYFNLQKFSESYDYALLALELDPHNERLLKNKDIIGSYLKTEAK